MLWVALRANRPCSCSESALLIELSDDLASDLHTFVLVLLFRLVSSIGPLDHPGSLCQDDVDDKVLFVKVLGIHIALHELSMLVLHVLGWALCRHVQVHVAELGGLLQLGLALGTLAGDRPC